MALAALLVYTPSDCCLLLYRVTIHVVFPAMSMVSPPVLFHTASAASPYFQCCFALVPFTFFPFLFLVLGLWALPVCVFCLVSSLAQQVDFSFFVFRFFSLSNAPAGLLAWVRCTCRIQCVCFSHWTVLSTRRHPAHPVSVLILRPRQGRPPRGGANVYLVHDSSYIYIYIIQVYGLKFDTILLYWK